MQLYISLAVAEFDDTQLINFICIHDLIRNSQNKVFNVKLHCLDTSFFVGHVSFTPHKLNWDNRPLETKICT